MRISQIYRHLQSVLPNCPPPPIYHAQWPLRCGFDRLPDTTVAAGLTNPSIPLDPFWPLSVDSNPAEMQFETKKNGKQLVVSVAKLGTKNRQAGTKPI